jgi:hypothetical protein
VWAPEHINGGACYAKDFGRQVPQECRSGTFDLAIYPYLKQCGRFHATQSIAFSTVKRCDRDLSDPRRVLLHGFMQDKNAFLERCLQPQDPTKSAAQTPPALSHRLAFWSRQRKSPEYRRERFLQALFRAQEVWALSQSGAR